MRTRRIAALALSGALIAGGTGVAIAAVAKDDDKQAEQAVLDDAAERLDVTPQKLRDALAAAQDAQLDQAAKDGNLTPKQADAIKAARKQARAEHGAGLLARRLDGVGLLLGEVAVLRRLVELSVLGRGQRVTQLPRRDVQALGGVVEDRLLGLLVVILRHRRDRHGASGDQRAAQRECCDSSCTHRAVLLLVVMGKITGERKSDVRTSSEWGGVLIPA